MTIMFESRRGDDDVVSLSWDAGDLSGADAMVAITALLNRPFHSGDISRPVDVVGDFPGSSKAPFGGVLATPDFLSRPADRCRRLVCGHPRADHEMLYDNPDGKAGSLTGCFTCGTPDKCRSYVGQPTETVGDRT